MLALRYLYFLALIIWLGGMITLGAVTAPAIFTVLTTGNMELDQALAGDIFGEILRRFHVLTYGAGVVLLGSLGAMMVLGTRPSFFWIRTGIVAAMLMISLYSGIWVSGEIENLQQEVGKMVSLLPEHDVRRLRFGRLHALSTTLMMLNIAGGLVLVFFDVARKRG